MNKIFIIFFIFFTTSAFADWMQEIIDNSDTQLTCVGNKVCDDNGCSELPTRFSFYFSFNDKNNKNALQCTAQDGCFIMKKRVASYPNVYFYDEYANDWSAEYSLKTNEFITYFEKSSTNKKAHTQYYDCENN